MKRIFLILTAFSALIAFSCAPLNESDISGISIAPPRVPSNVQATAGDSSSYVMLTWNAISNVDYYNVYYGTSMERFYTTPYQTTSTTYYDKEVYPGDVWYYYVTAVQGGIESEPSHTVYGYLNQTQGRWSDVEQYSNVYELEYYSSGSTQRYDEDSITTGSTYLYWFPVYGGSSYTITIWDSTRNSSAFTENLTPASLSVMYYPAGASSGTTCSAATTTFKATCTGYYILQVKATSGGYYAVSVDNANS